MVRRRRVLMGLGVLAGLVLLIGLGVVPPRLGAQPSGVGVFESTDCTTITAPVIGKTFCFDQTANTLKIWTGAPGWVPLAAQTYTLPNLPIANVSGSLAMLTTGPAGGALLLNDGGGWNCSDIKAQNIIIVTCPPFNAKPDGRNLTDGTVSGAPTTTFTSASAGFSSSTDVGKTIVIAGAGAAGVTLRTTIASVTNATTVVLAASASTSVAGANWSFSTDNRAALLSAFGAATTGTIVVFPPAASGYYGVVNPNSSGELLNLLPGTHLIGYGAKVQLDGSITVGGGVFNMGGNADGTIEGFDISESPALATTLGFSAIGIARKVSDNTLSSRSRVINNYIHGFKTVGGNGGCAVNAEVGATGLIVQGNFIDNNDCGVWLGTSTLYPLKDVAVVGNYINNTTTAAGDSPAFSVSGNAFMVSHNTAIDAIHPDTDDMNVAITGNTVRGAGVCLHTQGVGKVTFTGNTCSGITSFGVFVEESQDLTISTNLIGGALVNYFKNLQITGAFGTQRVRVIGNGFRGSASGAGMTSDASLSKSWFTLNQMQAVTGARFSANVNSVSNVVTDADETATSGLVQFHRGVTIDNTFCLNFQNTAVSDICIMSLDGSNDVVFQRGGGAVVGKILNATSSFSWTGGGILAGAPTGGDKGAGTINAVSHWTNGLQTTTASGAIVNASVTFNSGLGNTLTTDGMQVYCSTCNIANPCTGGGTGAMAKRLNGVFVCN